MKWQRDEKGMISDCGNYQIRNHGKKGGNQYCIWGKHGREPEPDCFCRCLRMGALDFCKRYCNEVIYDL